MHQRRMHTLRTPLLAASCAAMALSALTLSPQRAAAGPPIGINIQNVADYNGDLLFADAMKESRDWQDLAGTNLTGGQVDANGWPNQDAQIVVWHGIANMHGAYALSFNGQATIATGFGSATISGQTYNSATNTTTATLTYNSTDGSGLQVKFTNTKKTSASATNTGIANVKLMRPTSVGGTTAYSTSTTFTTQIKNLIAKFGVIRFMDYLATNANQQANWSDRLKPAYYSYNVTGPNYGWQGKAARGSTRSSLQTRPTRICGSASPRPPTIRT
jgi:hypothetical protein